MLTGCIFTLLLSVISLAAIKVNILLIYTVYIPLWTTTLTFRVLPGVFCLCSFTFWCSTDMIIINWFLFVIAGFDNVPFQ